MEGERATISLEKTEMDPENLKVIEWEEFDQELARFCSLSSALNEAKDKKLNLQRKMESLIQVEAASLSRLNELEDMREKLEARKMKMVNLSMHYAIAAENTKGQEEELNVQVTSLLVAGTSLSLSRKQLQELIDLLAGGKGYIRLKNLQYMLRMRQQCMVSQVSMLYPVKISAGPRQEQELESFPRTSKSGNFAGSKPVNPGSLTILGLHLTMLPFKVMSFFTDKKEAQRSSSALGYIAHAVSLISSYLKVPLRYPVRLGGSHSHIIDNAPSMEPTPTDLALNITSSTNLKHMEFPLYLDGQDTTRAAYAVFLLNKRLQNFYFSHRQFLVRHFSDHRNRRMAEEIKVEITRRETIKPSSPTPQHLRSVEFSIMDQLAPDFYVPLVLFYPFSSSANSHQRPPLDVASERVQRLRKTLSKTLTLFYPLAGRVRNNLFIECNDDGVEFVEARVPCLISDLLQKPDLEVLKKFLPVETESKKSSTGGCLLLVQATIFDCGGIAIGLSISHKIVDGSTLSAFINSWSKTTLATSDHVHDQDKHVIKPDFATASRLFPPLLELSSSEAPAVEFIQDKCVTRRYVFDTKKIEALQSKAASESVKNPTRVEAISGLIWKCAMEASRSNSRGFLRKSVWCQNMNMRPRIVPPLAENVAGNLVGYFAAKIEENENDNTDIKVLVDNFRKRTKEAVENYGKITDTEEVKRSLDEYGKLIKSAEIDNYNCTSWCRFPLYESDFGFGKPIWISIASVAYKNCVLLMDAREGDGIEACLMLREADMVLVESNKELLAFASLNPSVI